MGSFRSKYHTTLIMNFFGKKPTVKEQLKENDKALRKVTRDVERDRRELEREEKKLEAEIKKAAKMGNKQAATVLAKQLINVRKQKTRTYNMTSKVQAAVSTAKAMGANVKMSQAMAETSKTMTNDALDDMLNESGDEEEGDAIVNQVLDEIGIEISGKLNEAPSAAKGTLGAETISKKNKEADDEIERMLAQLKS